MPSRHSARHPANKNGGVFFMHMMHISTPSGPAQRPPVQDSPESVPYPCFQPDGNASTLPPDPRTFLFPFRMAGDSEAIQKNKT